MSRLLPQRRLSNYLSLVAIWPPTIPLPGAGLFTFSILSLVNWIDEERSVCLKMCLKRRRKGGHNRHCRRMKGNQGGGCSGQRFPRVVSAPRRARRSERNMLLSLFLLLFLTRLVLLLPLLVVTPHRCTLTGHIGNYFFMSRGDGVGYGQSRR